MEWDLETDMRRAYPGLDLRPGRQRTASDGFVSAAEPAIGWERRRRLIRLGTSVEHPIPRVIESDTIRTSVAIWSRSRESANPGWEIELYPGGILYATREYG